VSAGWAALSTVAPTAVLPAAFLTKDLRFRRSLNLVTPEKAHYCTGKYHIKLWVLLPCEELSHNHRS
jgi:hypothetical protein